MHPIETKGLRFHQRIIRWAYVKYVLEPWLEEINEQSGSFKISFPVKWDESEIDSAMYEKDHNTLQ